MNYNDDDNDQEEHGTAEYSLLKRNSVSEI